MIQSINFKPIRSDFQKNKLADNINNMISSENLLIFAGRTTNLYETTPEQYKTILTNNVTKTPKSRTKYPIEHRQGNKKNSQNSSTGKKNGALC